MKYEVGDIVLIHDFKYSDGKSGSLHSFVIVYVEKDEFEILPFEYLCMLISSQKEKESYPYNMPIKRDNINGLKRDSHVKCDYIYEGIKEKDIFMKVGIVTDEQYETIINLHMQSISK